MWNIQIEKVSNGYKLSYWDEESKDRRTVVFEYVDEDNEIKMEQLTLQKVFFYLMDCFAVYNDKHANDGKGQYMTIKVDGEEE